MDAQASTRGVLRWLLALCALAASTGCYAEASTGVATTAYVPAHVGVYPQEYYDGHVVYLIGDHWYYNDGARWVYYRREPDVLVRRRTVIRQAPPVVRERSVVRAAPPARYYQARPAPRYEYRQNPARRRAARPAPRAY